MFLLDTNIFIEILLDQDKKGACKKFLADHMGELCITDFTLHSIGIILSRYHKFEVFRTFLDDIIPNINLISLPHAEYGRLIDVQREFGLDFDDAYQLSTARYYGARLVTMDNDFRKIQDAHISFL